MFDKLTFGALLELFGRAMLAKAAAPTDPNHRPGRHYGAKHGSRKAGRQRLKPARGAGSINAEADMQQLVRDRRFDEAAALYERHNSIRGCPKMRWGDRWYADYKATRSVRR